MKRTYTKNFPEIYRNLNGVFIKGHKLNEGNGYGLSFDTKGNRWVIICRDRKKVPFARALIEGYFHIKLNKNQIVHHINEISTDDRIENLMVLTRSEHLTIHRKKVLGARKYANKTR